MKKVSDGSAVLLTQSSNHSLSDGPHCPFSANMAGYRN